MSNVLETKVIVHVMHASWCDSGLPVLTNDDDHNLQGKPESGWADESCKSALKDEYYRCGSIDVAYV